MIPRVFHQIWLGCAPLHPLMVKWREDLLRLNPDWELRVWTSPDGTSSVSDGVETFVSRFPDLLDRACHFSQRTNILRYELIHKLGGVYVDTDFEHLRPVPADLHLVAPGAFVAPYSHVPGKFASAVFGARAGHPWLASVLGLLREEDPAVSLSMGSDFLTRATLAYEEDDAPHVLPRHVFYHFLNPWLCPQGMLTEEARSRLHPETCAIHQWSSKWYDLGFRPLSTKKE